MKGIDYAQVDDNNVDIWVAGSNSAQGIIVKKRILTN
jgi:hypothetical protein